MLRKTGQGHQTNQLDWDGIDRRSVERRAHQSSADVNIDDSQVSVQNTSNWRKWLNTSVLAAVLPILAAVITFGSTASTRISTLELKQQTLQDKISEIRSMEDQLKIQMKEAEQSRNAINDHINNLEDSLREYNQKRKN